ncbi:nucleotidyltransferase family protein [Thalassospira xiamenensis]|uniref:nucleotidyltransferase family protein n=1 Tax=Thalassospira xiamenensis TaxID=220697 RepID=UPI000DEDC0B1|nr:nucleotidyltransferase family protein [Thalassospira xiamenensis]
MDINRHLLPHTASLIEAIEALNKMPAPNIFLIIIDHNRHVVGTLTDGDVRRAFLKGKGGETPVHDCMGVASKLGLQYQYSRNETLLNGLRARPKFLPVVDQCGVIVDILTSETDLADRALGFVMAGGKGTRLGELTKNKPKPLMEVDDKPILGHVLDRLEEANVSKTFISVNYLSEQIGHFVDERINKTNIELVYEDLPLGTAGAIGLVSERINLPVIVLNGDIITNLNVEALIESHARSGNGVTIAVTRHDIKIPFGVVRHTEDGVFLGIDEKPTMSHFVAAGVYVLSPEVCALIPKRKRADMPDVINLAKEIGLGVGIFPIHEYWIDIGRPQDLQAARQSDIKSDRKIIQPKV